MNDINPIFLNSLSLDSDVPLYSQLVSIVKRCISGGLLKPGDIIPSESELCRRFDISRSTVRQAVGALESEGMVVRKQGKGTFVSKPKLRRKSDLVNSFTSEVNDLGLVPSSTLLEFDLITPTPKIMRELELAGPEIKVYRFTRLRNVNGVPMFLETSCYPQYIYPSLTRELLESHSFYSLLYEVGIVPVFAEDSYKAIVLNGSNASLLDCPQGSAGFSVKRKTRTDSGLVYEYTESIIRGDKVSLEINYTKDGPTLTRCFNYFEE